jgi:predicted RND superfamily exporter protein
VSSGRWNRLIDGLVRYRIILLCLALALTALSVYPANQVSFDQSIESLYSPGNPHLLDYLESKKLFGGDEFVFLTYTDPELFDEAGQERLTNLAALLAEVPGIAEDSVQSLDTYLELTSRGAFRSRRQRVLDFSRGVLLGDDNQTTAIAMRLVPEADATQPRAATIAQLRDIAAKQTLPTYIVGEPTLVLDMFRYAQEDGRFMGWAASALLACVILFFLRNVRSIVLPFVIVQMTILWTKAALWTSHLQLTMVSSVLDSLVTIIGVSTVVYLSFYYQELCERYDRETAFRKMLQVIGTDIVWVCLTTAAGFAAHFSSNLHPVRSFGLTMVIGSLLVLLAIALVLPCGMLLGARRGTPVKARGERQVNQFLHSVTLWVLHHPKGIGLGTLIAVAFGVGGLLQLRLETDFSANFRSSSPVVQSLTFMEERLGGAGIWEVNFSSPSELDPEQLGKVRELAAQLRELRTSSGAGLTKVVAITDGLDLVPRVPILVPDDAARLRWMDGLQPEFGPSLFNPEQGRMRIMLRARERQSAEDKERLIAQVKETARTKFPDAEVTGLFVLLTYLVESLLRDQWTGLVVGGVSLVAMMSIAYRSVWMGLVSLVPNVLPIILLLGAMGWAGVPINIGTAMISSDTMGLTIHDSIFYLSAYHRARLSGLDFRGALSEVQTEVRRPLIYSNVALIVGFLVLTSSHFVPLIYFGALVSTAIAGGLIVNLLLIPLLLQLGEYERRH